MTAYAIVGNAPVAIDYGSDIDTASCVIRCNTCPNFGVNTGRKIDIVAICNWGTPARKVLQSWAEGNAALRQANRLLLSVDSPAPKSFLKRLRRSFRKSKDHTTEIIRHIADGRQVARIATAESRALTRRLRELGAEDEAMPSTGLMVINHVLRQCTSPRDTVDLYGFTHSGWRGHPWEQERMLIDEWVASGRVRRHAPSPR